MEIRDPSITKEASVRTNTRTYQLRFTLFRRPLVVAVLPVVMVIASACSSSTSTSSPPQATAAIEWQQANHDLANTRDASSSRITSENVSQLGVGWTYGIDGASAFGSLATSPLVLNGTVYLQDLKSNVYAIDFRSGKLEWQKRYNADNVGPNGAGFDDGTLFVTNGMQPVVALDATSGKEIWSKRIVSVLTQGITQQLTAHDGILYVSTIPGSSASHFYEGGGMGIIHAPDEQTGNELWSFNTVKNGRLWGNPKVNSGGGAWYPPAVDTSNGTTYWGIGNPAPYPGTKAFPSASSRPGPNLYTDSELALNNSGELQWFQQVKPHDLFDGDFQISPILATATIGGSSRDIVIGSGKLGHVVAFDRQTGEELWDTPVGLHRNDDLTTIPRGEDHDRCPGRLRRRGDTDGARGRSRLRPRGERPYRLHGQQFDPAGRLRRNRGAERDRCQHGQDPVDRQARRPGLWRGARGGRPRVHVDVHRRGIGVRPSIRQAGVVDAGTRRHQQPDVRRGRHAARPGRTRPSADGPRPRARGNRNDPHRDSERRPHELSVAKSLREHRAADQHPQPG